MPAPLILTLALDPAAAATLDCLRARYFPAEQNHIRAHITLFHHLPGEELPAITDGLRGECARITPFALRVAGIRPLGRGTALGAESAELVAIRAGLARRFDAWLTAQDRQGFRPHVTVQNKVDPAQALAVQAELGGLPAIAATATGLDLWHYLGGPWGAAGHFAFAAR